MSNITPEGDSTGDGDYVEVSTSVIPQVTVVRFYDETFEHIAEHEEYPSELPCIRGAIVSTVQNPTVVTSSRSGHYVFEDANTTNAGGDPLRVPVKLIDDTSARAKTAFFAERSSKEVVVYRRRDD